MPRSRGLAGLRCTDRDREDPRLLRPRPDGGFPADAPPRLPRADRALRALLPLAGRPGSRLRGQPAGAGPATACWPHPGVVLSSGARRSPRPATTAHSRGSALRATSQENTMSVVALHPRHSDCEPAAPVSGDVFGGDDRVVLEVGYGITVYPPVEEGERWRAVWYEDGQRRPAEAVREDKLAAKLEKVRERLASGAEHLQRPGADLIAWYLSPDRRHRGGKPWSRRHADPQR